MVLVLTCILWTFAAGLFNNSNIVLSVPAALTQTLFHRIHFSLDLFSTNIGPLLSTEQSLSEPSGATGFHVWLPWTLTQPAGKLQLFFPFTKEHCINYGITLRPFKKCLNLINAVCFKYLSDWFLINMVVLDTRWSAKLIIHMSFYCVLIINFRPSLNDQGLNSSAPLPGS